MKYRKKKPRCGEAFHEVLIQRAISPRTRVTNEAFIRREGEKGVQLAERLRSYRDFLDDARRHKARSGSVSIAFEQEVLSQARQALQDGYAFIDTSLKLTKHLKHVGVIDDILETSKEALGQVDEVHLVDLWQDMLDIEDAAEVLAEQGLSQATIDQLTSAVESLDVSLMLQEDEIAVRRNQDGRVSRLAPPAGPGKARNVAELLSANQFDAAVSAIVQSGVVPVDVIARSREAQVEEIDPYDAFLTTAIQARAGLTRHVRRLEHTGMAAFQGGEATTILVIVGLVALLVGGYLKNKYCEETIVAPDGSESISPGDETPGRCLLGVLLIFIGIAIAFEVAYPFPVARAGVTSFPSPETGVVA
jgi:hypothetical protein